MRRVDDEVIVETIAGGCRLYSGIELVTDMHGPATLTMQVGDDASWRDLSQIFYPGRECRLFCNGQLLFTGRFETNRVPTTFNGAVVNLVARTRMSDARYASASITTKVNGVSIREFILSLFAPLGFAETDFIFDAASDRDLVTGVRGSDRAQVDLEPLQEAKAKIQPGEEIFEAASRHLKRHHLSLWDSANGKVVVGAPNGAQSPLYKLRSKRVNGGSNNIVAPTRIRDWSELPMRINVYGTTSSDDDDPIPIRGLAIDHDVLDVFNDTGHFGRVLVIPLEGTKTQAKADAQAQRELASRSKEKDAWEHEVDSWTYNDGYRAIPWALNTTADVDVDSVGTEGAGRYLIHKVVLNLDVQSAAVGQLTLVKPNVLVF